MVFVGDVGEAEPHHTARRQSRADDIRIYVILLKPGATDRVNVDLNGVYNLNKPGTYEVEFLLDNFKKVDATSDIKPLKVRFKIVD